MVYELSAYHQKICYRFAFSAYCLSPFLFCLSKEHEKIPKGVFPALSLHKFKDYHFLVLSLKFISKLKELLSRRALDLETKIHAYMSGTTILLKPSVTLHNQRNMCSIQVVTPKFVSFNFLRVI
jgi:hypothetical protein